MHGENTIVVFAFRRSADPGTDRADCHVSTGHDYRYDLFFCVDRGNIVVDDNECGMRENRAFWFLMKHARRCHLCKNMRSVTK